LRLEAQLEVCQDNARFVQGVCLCGTGLGLLVFWTDKSDNSARENAGGRFQNGILVS